MKADGAGPAVFTLGPADKGERLDKVLAGRLGADVSRTRLQALIAAGCVTLDGVAVTEPAARAGGQGEVAVRVPPPVDASPKGQAIPFTILFEDAHLLVLDKPAGLVVHPAPGHAEGTLVNALIAHCGDSLSGIGGVRRPGIVHRLDKDTSGVMVVAKTDAAHRGLTALFADHGRSGSLERRYLALAWGHPGAPAGTVDKPLGRHPQARDRMAVVPAASGRRAVTHWRIARALPETSLLECRLETGRTHQIRVHMAAIGHPLVGDAVYGAGFRTKAARLPAGAASLAGRLGRQALHAATLGFDHPVTGASLSFSSAPPADLSALIAALAEAEEVSRPPR